MSRNFSNLEIVFVLLGKQLFILGWSFAMKNYPYRVLILSRLSLQVFRAHSPGNLFNAYIPTMYPIETNYLSGLQVFRENSTAQTAHSIVCFLDRFVWASIPLPAERIDWVFADWQQKGKNKHWKRCTVALSVDLRYVVKKFLSGIEQLHLITFVLGEQDLQLVTFAFNGQLFCIDTFKLQWQ